MKFHAECPEKAPSRVFSMHCEASRRSVSRCTAQVPLLECTVRPGEALFFPWGWWHSTLNIDTAVYITTFLSRYSTVQNSTVQSTYITILLRTTTTQQQGQDNIKGGI